MPAASEHIGITHAAVVINVTLTEEVCGQQHLPLPGTCAHTHLLGRHCMRLQQQQRQHQQQAQQQQGQKADRIHVMAHAEQGDWEEPGYIMSSGLNNCCIGHSPRVQGWGGCCGIEDPTQLLLLLLRLQMLQLL